MIKIRNMEDLYELTLEIGDIIFYIEKATGNNLIFKVLKDRQLERITPISKDTLWYKVTDCKSIADLKYFLWVFDEYNEIYDIFYISKNQAKLFKELYINN